MPAPFSTPTTRPMRMEMTRAVRAFSRLVGHNLCGDNIAEHQRVLNGQINAAGQNHQGLADGYNAQKCHLADDGFHMLRSQEAGAENFCGHQQDNQRTVDQEQRQKLFAGERYVTGKQCVFHA